MPRARRRPQGRPYAPEPEYEQYAQVGQELQKEFESRIFWFAGGVVTLALGGAQFLGSTRDLHGTQFLDWGAVLLFAGLIVAMIGFRVSAWMFNLLAEGWHDEEESKIASAMRLKPWASICDWASFILVILGSGSIGYFYLVNVPG